MSEQPNRPPNNIAALLARLPKTGLARELVELIKETRKEDWSSLIEAHLSKRVKDLAERARNASTAVD